VKVDMPLLVNSEFLLGETAFEVESRSVISSGQAEVVEVISDADACVITTKNDEVRRASRKKIRNPEQWPRNKRT
jgi:hypothetical protein